MTTTDGPKIDLTPFGFTPTETAVYFALLKRGPSSGYAVAREMSLARANAYQALRGLVAKKAAVVIDEDPQRFRAIRTDALYAQIVSRQATQLDRLEAELGGTVIDGADPIVQLAGRRAVTEWMSRTAAREPGPLTVVARLTLLLSLVPVLRKRVVDSATTTVYVIGAEGDLPVRSTARVPEDRMRRFFFADTAFLLTDGGVMVARIDEADMSAYWTSDVTLTGVVRAAVALLTAAGE